MISLITAADAIVPWIILAHSGAGVANDETAIPVKTRDTPECGNNVKPKYFLTVSGHLVIVAPNLAPKYFPKALVKI